MRTIDFLMSLHDVCHFQTREGAKIGKASNSEMRRWIRNGVLTINGEKITAEEADIPMPVESCWLFTKQKRITIL